MWTLCRQRSRQWRSEAVRIMLKWTWIAVVVIVLDQITKIAASTNLQMFQPIEIMPYFNLTLAHNTGTSERNLRREACPAERGWH